MRTLLGTLDAGTPNEAVYIKDERGTIYVCCVGYPERFFCSKELWLHTATYAALEAQRQQVDMRTYWEQQKP